MYRTLVADDDFLVRSYLKTLDSWEKAGYEIVDDAEDGEEAYNFLRKEKVDVLVTDLSMPVMDGIELIRRIRELLYEQGFTISGARNKLNERGSRNVVVEEMPVERVVTVSSPVDVDAIRSELEAVLALLTPPKE